MNHYIHHILGWRAQQMRPFIQVLRDAALALEMGRAPNIAAAVNIAMSEYSPAMSKRDPVAVFSRTLALLRFTNRGWHGEGGHLTFEDDQRLGTVGQRTMALLMLAHVLENRLLDGAAITQG